MSELPSPDSEAARTHVPGTSIAASGQASGALDSASPDLEAAAENAAENAEEHTAQPDSTIHDTLPVFQKRGPPPAIKVRLSLTVVNQVAVSPDGTRLAAAYNGGLWVLDGITGNKLLTSKGHRGRQTASVAFSPDGKRLTSGGDDKWIKVWDTTTGRETLTLRGHTNYVSYVAFSADGKRLTSARAVGTVKIWDARPWTPELRAQAQARSALKRYRQQVESLGNLRAQLRDAEHLSDLARERALEWSELFWIHRE